jgi:hypothetical protein
MTTSKNATWLTLVLASSAGCNSGRTLSLGDHPSTPVGDMAAMGPAPSGRDMAVDVPDAGDRSRPDMGMGRCGPEANERVWSLLVGPGLWNQLIKSASIDGSERIFVSDGASVFVVAGSNAGAYVDATAIGSVLGSASKTIHAVDVGPDGRVYILTDTAVLVSAGAGDVALLRAFSRLQGPSRLAVVAADQVLVIDDNGLHRVNAAGETLVYSLDALMGGSSCSSQELTAQPDGTFFYMPGCNGSPLIKGKADGSGAGVLLKSDLTPRFYADNFNGIGRSPCGGGFVLSVENNAGSWNEGLIQSDLNGNWSPITTTPTMLDYANMLGDYTTFHSRPIQVGPSGALYVVSADSVYRVSP